MRIDEIPNHIIWQAHIEAKKSLIDYINKNSAANLDTNVLTLGFARRATAYKRTTFIFSDLDRLRDINKRGRLQFVFAGKAHPRDEAGKRIIREIYNYRSQLREDFSIVYLENYNMELASRLTSGVDV